MFSICSGFNCFIVSILQVLSQEETHSETLEVWHYEWYSVFGMKLKSENSYVLIDIFFTFILLYFALFCFILLILVYLGQDVIS